MSVPIALPSWRVMTSSESRLVERGHVREVELDRHRASRAGGLAVDGDGRAGAVDQLAVAVEGEGAALEVDGRVGVVGGLGVEPPGVAGVGLAFEDGGHVDGDRRAERVVARRSWCGRSRRRGRFECRRRLPSANARGVAPFTSVKPTAGCRACWPCRGCR